MDTSKATVIIAYGTHITENLKHHKASDVQRILEEKGFELMATEAPENGTRHYKLPNSPDNGKRTSIRFDEQGFVNEENGVAHYEEAGL